MPALRRWRGSGRDDKVRLVGFWGRSSMRWLILAVLLALGAGEVAHAAPADAPYDPRLTFAPLTFPEPVNRYRSGSGAPGPDHWQNRADYQITVRLDAGAKILSGDVTISYTNNSPDALDVLWLQLDQNIYRSDSRAGAVGGRARTQFSDGDVLEAVEIESGGKLVAADHLVSDTRLRVRLPA